MRVSKVSVIYIYIYRYIYFDYKAKEVLIFISTEVVSVSNRMAILQSIKYNWKILAMT